MSEASLTIKEMQEEMSCISGMLQPFTKGGDTVDITHVLTTDDLDRKKAEESDWSSMQAALKLSEHKGVAVAGMVIHEEHRIRRDINIARTSHKRLMLASLSTMYSRMKELEYQINNMGNDK